MASVLTAPIPFITLNDEDCFDVAPEAIAYLKSIPKDHTISVVAIAGLYRTGKSYLLNQLLNRTTTSTTFGVGGTVNAFTKGIWIYGEPLITTTTPTPPTSNPTSTSDPSSSKSTIIFMDTEGLGSAQRSQTQDTRIFALALLLSSYFIYNSRGIIDSNAIEELSLVVNLTKYIQANTPTTPTSELSSFFPSFLWVVRDFTLQLVDATGKSITSKEYLEKALTPTLPNSTGGGGGGGEIDQKNQIRQLLTAFFPVRDCITMVRPLNDEALLRELMAQPMASLREEFQLQLQDLKDKVFASLTPKIVMSKPLNGSMLVTLAENYIHAFNSGKAPIISNAWDRVLCTQYEDLVDQCKLKYIEYSMDASMALQATPPIPMEVPDLESLYLTTQARVQEYFVQNMVSKDSLEFSIPYQTQVHQYMADQYTTVLELNEMISKEYNKKLIHDIYTSLQNVPLSTSQTASQSTTTTSMTLASRDNTDHVIGTLSSKLKQFQKQFQDCIPLYRTQAKGPYKDQVLVDFLSNKMLEEIVEWGNTVFSYYRTQESVIQKQKQDHKQQYKTIQGTQHAIQEMYTQQQETYARALSTLQDRLLETKMSINYEMGLKVSEIERLNQQMQTLVQFQQDTFATYTITLTHIQQEYRTKESKYEMELQEIQDLKANQTLKQNEKMTHYRQQTSSLLQQQQVFLQTICDLEKQCGTIQGEQMKEIFTMEHGMQQKMKDFQLKLDNDMYELKQQTITDIRFLKQQQDEELVQFESALQNQQAILSALQEQVETKRRLAIQDMDNKKIRHAKQDDCRLM